MLANEPILLLVTIYTSLVYGVLYGRVYIPYMPVGVFRLTCKPLRSLRSLARHLYRKASLYYKSIRFNLHWYWDRGHHIRNY